MALGYVLGRVYRWDAASRRRRLLIGAGLAATAAWVVIRTVNGYGDPRPWESYPTTIATILSFLSAEKYPPSLDFLAMTLGPALIVLGLIDELDLDRATPGASRAGLRARAVGAAAVVARPLATLGAVPLFFYLLQWYVAHGLAVLAELMASQDISWHFMAPPERFFSVPPGAGFPLPVVYLLWLTALAILYPLCRWYRGVRARRGGLLHYL
jgi:uncharacterized membrane protein